MQLGDEASLGEIVNHLHDDVRVVLGQEQLEPVLETSMLTFERQVKSGEIR